MSAPLCRLCERPLRDHVIFHDAPTPEQLEGLVEADFHPLAIHGMYCPPEPPEA